MSQRDPESLDCEAVEPLLSEHAAGELAGKVAARVSAHLASCAACRDAAGGLSAMEAALRSEPMADPGPEFADRVIDALPAQEEPAKARTVRWLRPAPIAGLALAAAAAAVLLFGLPGETPAELQESVAVRDVIPESWVGLLEGLDGDALDAVVEALEVEVNEAESESFRGGLSAAGAWSEVAALAADDPGAILDVATSNDQGGK